MASFDEMKKMVRDQYTKGEQDQGLDSFTVMSAANNYLTTLGFIAPTSNMTDVSLESMLMEAPVVNTVATSDHIKIKQMIQDMGVPAEHPAMEAMTLQVWRVLHGKNARASHFQQASNAPGSDGISPRLALASLIGAEGWAAQLSEEGGAYPAFEAFGVNADNISSDIRLNVAVTVMMMYKSFIDRGLSREVHDDVQVTYSIKDAEVYDLTVASANDAATRYGSHRKSLISLFRKPEPATTTTKPVKPLVARDTLNPSALWNAADDGYLKTQQKINLFDLSKDPTLPGYNVINFTDMIAEGARLSEALIEVTHTNGPTITKEQFKVDLTTNDLGLFNNTSNQLDSTDRNANITNQYFSLFGGGAIAQTQTYTGGNSAILDGFANHKVVLEINVQSNLNLKTSFVSTQGFVTAQLATEIPGATPNASVVTEFGKLTFAVVGFKVKATFEEENLRKTSTAVRTAVRQKTVPIAPGRSIIVEYSLQQNETTDVVDVVSTVNALGDANRHLTTLRSTLTNVKARIDAEKANVEIPYAAKIGREFPAGTMVNPYVVESTVDVGNFNNNGTLTGISTMRESERLSEVHSKVIRTFLGDIAALHGHTLYTNVLDTSETVVYKVFAHRTIIDSCIGLPLYHQILEDKRKGEWSTTRDKSDYSLQLPSGVRLDFIGTNFDSLQATMLYVPVRDSKPNDVTSFGTIKDRGTYVGSYSPTQDQAATRRIYSNPRAALIPTNGMGGKMTVTNLELLYPSLDDFKVAA